MKDLAKLALLATVCTVSCLPTLAAASPSESGPHSITVVGDGKTFIGDCSGKTVRLLGNRQTIALFGTCRSIDSSGSASHITFDNATSLQIRGDGNFVKWKRKPGSVSAVGRNDALTAQ